MKISEFIDYLEQVKNHTGDITVEIYGSEQFGYACCGAPKGFRHWPEMKNKEGKVVGTECVVIFCEGHEA